MEVNKERACPTLPSPRVIEQWRLKAIPYVSPPHTNPHFRMHHRGVPAPESLPHPTHRGHQWGVCECQALQVSSQTGGHNCRGRYRLDTGRGDCGRR